MGDGGATPMEVEMGEDDARNPTAQFLTRVKGEAPIVSNGHASAAKARHQPRDLRAYLQRDV